MKLIIIFLLFSFAAIGQDTTYITYQVIHDTTETTTIAEKIIHTGDTTITFSDTTYNAFYKYQVFAVVRGQSSVTIRLYDTIPTHDTTFNCQNCAVHDTTVMVITPPPPIDTTFWGVFILNQPTQSFGNRIRRAKNLSAKLTVFRYNYDRGGAVYSVQTIKDSGLLVAMSFQNEPVQNIAYFPTGPALVAAGVTLDSLLTVSKPDLLSIENEEGNTSYHKGTPQSYLDELNYLTVIAHNHNIAVSNGGTLLGLVYYIRKYYQDNGLTDSVTWINNAAGLIPQTNAYGQQQIDWYSVIIPGFRNSNMDYVNIHHYEPPKTDTLPTVQSGLFEVMINFLATNTGKRIITTEFGSRNHSTVLLTSMCNTVRSKHLPWAIYFDGNGNLAIANEPAYSAFLNGLP